MLDLIRAEWMKLRRGKVLLLLALWALAFPLMIIIKDLQILLAGTGLDSTEGWLQSIWLIPHAMMLPAIGGFALTYMVQKEYMDGTVIACLTAPVSRPRYLWSKLLVWAMWYMLIDVLLLAVELAGFGVLFGRAALADIAAGQAALTLVTGALTLCTMLPVAVAAILQQKVVYPALVISLLLAALAIGAVYWSEFWACLVPWSAATYWGMAFFMGQAVNPLAYASIGGCLLLSLAVAQLCFSRQQL